MKTVSGVLLLLTAVPWSGRVAADVEIMRDKWGIAHVYGDDEPSAFFGAGYASAEDRMLQMLLKRRVVQGRVAETFGPGKNDRFVKSDLRYRTFGLMELSARLLASEDAATRRNLEAYAAGVNAYLDEHRGKLSPLFDELGGHPEPWSADDSIALWLRLSDRFSTGWDGEVQSKRNYEVMTPEQRQSAPPPTARPMLDNDRVIVPEDEFARQSPELHARLSRKTKLQLQELSGLPADPKHQPDGPNFSHNWLVGGAASTTGKPILESDPHYGIISPAFWYEIHIVGGRYNVRGMGIPGTPGLLMGWNDRVAWGVTALGGDHADLFEERVHPDNANLYQFKDQWLPFEARDEVIVVKGGQPRHVTVRSTRHGPVVNDLLEGVKPGEIFALQYLLLQGKTCSLEATLNMMAATNWTSFRKAASTYVGPPTHLIYADADDNIGYQTMGAAAIRYEYRRLPRQGWTGEDEWEGLVPFEELPHSFNPKNARIGTANNLAVGEWYPYLTTTAFGDGPRSLRIHEVLDQDRKFSVEDFRTLIHMDDGHPVLRDTLILARAVVAEAGAPTPEVGQAMEALQDWDDHFRTDRPGYPVARGIVEATSKRLLRGSPLEQKYGTRFGGICRMLREQVAQFNSSGRAPQDPDVRRWLMEIVQSGWEQRGYDVQQREAVGYNWRSEESDDAEIAARAKADKHKPQEGLVRYLPYQDNHEGFGSLAPEFDLVTDPMPVPHTHTLWSQEGNSYTQIVDLGNIDNSLSMLPPGNSENPRGPHFADQLEYLHEGTLHPAPLTRPAVEAVRESTRHLPTPMIDR
ncbi:MAG: penicillin acylase family protein [Planctomycetaceae bacterium]